MERFKKFNAAAVAESMSDDSRIKSLQDKIEYTQKRKENAKWVRDDWMRKASENTDSAQDERIESQLDGARQTVAKWSAELERLQEFMVKAKDQYRQQNKTEAVDVADISVGKKKAKPVGVKADEPLKGYAYNEKAKGQNEESEMSLDDIKKKYAKEIIAYQDGDSNNLSGGASMALYGYRGSDALKTDDADEFDDFVMGLKMGAHKKTNEQQSMDTLLDMLEETNMDEALSPKEKEKRLKMIKRAVEKLNKANIERVKKMAMRDMKAAGMFDDAIEENSAIGGYRDNSRDGQQGPKTKTAAPQVSQIEQLKKKLESAYDQRDIHDAAQRKYMERAKAIRDSNPKDLNGIHGAEASADNQEEMAQKVSDKISDIRDQIANLKK